MNELATLVRRLEGSKVIVEFGAPVDPTTPSGQKLVEFGEQPDVHLIRDGDVITGVECPDKSYIQFLNDVNASKDTIRAFRAALDDSKKARRERMRR